MVLKKEYYNINLKSKRYIQINILNDKIELYEEHNNGFRKKFFDEYKEQLEYLCIFIKENNYYEKIKYLSNNGNLSIYVDFLNFGVNIDNQFEISCLYKLIKDNNINDSFTVICRDKKLLTKIIKGSIPLQSLLENIQIKKEKISNNILKEIEELNVTKVKKKLKRKG